MHKAVCAIFAAVAAACVSAPVEGEPRVAHGEGLATKKSAGEVREARALLATLVQTHTDERVMLDDTDPPQARFDALLADRVTGSHRDLDPKLLGLLRELVKKYPAARVELVSGFRSPKLNEMLRKKGHNVASHSQHSLGHAVDFRIVPAGESEGVDPRELEKQIRQLGWIGGVGVYTQKHDWFVHADVGPNRRWNG